MLRRNIKITLFLFAIFLANIDSFAQTLSQDLSAIADIVVDKNGSGDFLTVQEGVNSVPNDKATRTIILVKEGTYKEKVIIGYKKTNVILVGEDVDSTIITYDDWGDKYATATQDGHTFSTYTVRADAHGFQAYNITFENTTTKGQGVAFHSNGDKQILYHCKLLGYQDTYFDNFRTRRYIKDCFIDGVTDFIFGFGVTLFDSCQINNNGSGWTTASSTPQNYEFGHVFRHCRITGKPGVNGAYLGRPWFPYSNTIFYECFMDGSINSKGWEDWDKRSTTCIYREFNNYGPGSDTTGRVTWSSQLPESLADRYVTDTILAASNFPTHIPWADTAEINSFVRRFAKYPGRGDTILFSGRGEGHLPYPTDDWSPVFDQDLLNIIDKHTIYFIDEANRTIDIEKILLDDVELEGFDKETSRYPFKLANATSPIPEVKVVGTGYETLSIVKPETLPGYIEITAVCKDKSTNYSFNIFVSADSLYWSTQLEAVRVNFLDKLEFEDGKYNYNVFLDEGDTVVKRAIVYKSHSDQSYVTVIPEEIPGDIIITVTALDGVTEKEYKLSVDFYTGINNIESTKNQAFVLNPVYEDIKLHSKEVLSDVTFQLYDINGRIVQSTKINDIQKGVNDLGINVSNLSKGLYIYKLNYNNQTVSGKLMKN